MKSQIGTVTLLQDRVYGEVAVPAGTYPVYRDDLGIHWEMQGYPSSVRGGIEILGDGMFAVEPAHDEIYAPEPVEVPSRDFEPEAFRRFVATDPLCVEGPNQRLRFDVAFTGQFPASQEVAHVA